MRELVPLRYWMVLFGIVLQSWRSPAGLLIASEQNSVDQIQYFENRVRPLLVEHCLTCHSSEKLKGGLSLESRGSILQGGDSGPAVVPGDPAGSLMMQAIRYDGLEMPPQEKLSEAKIRVLENWIKAGAPWPDSPTPRIRPPQPQGLTITNEDRQHWAFQPIRPVSIPASVSASHPIDSFLHARLSAEGLAANRRAPTKSLIRRAYLGLTGLPPSLNELQQWADHIGGDELQPFHEGKYAELLDELLSRPAYGEHWARHWLDVVRFGQSNGYERDGYKPFSWRYRDYVIQAFQQDKPYDRFVLEQIAGDEIPDSDAASRTATGFYRLGAWDDEPDDKRQAEFDELDDVMVTIGAAFMGLTIGCARCHDHKFDPIPQADYYRLLAYLRNIQRYDNPQTTLQSATSIPISDDLSIRKAVDSLQQRVREREQALAAVTDAEAKKKIQEMPVDHNLSCLEWTLSVREHATSPPPTHVLIRGNAGSLGPLVEPGFPEVLNVSNVSPTDSSMSVFESASSLRDIFPSSGRRLVLARWLTDPQHPLTPRVIVNRVWHYHFGRGIVATTADFGKVGDPPSHPELLDWLAHDFVTHGWSIKRLHRMIMTSEAYRRSSQMDLDQAWQQVAMTKDPENRFLWRFSLRRLDAESIRDRMLFSSGELNPSSSGIEMYPLLSGEVLAGQSRPGLGWESSPAEAQCRRSIYAMVKRSVRDPLLEAFDYSNATSPLPERPNTTVAPQALILLHGRFTADRASALAQHIVKSEVHPQGQVREIFHAILQRPPSDHERKIAMDSLQKFEAELRPRAGRISFRPDVPVSLYSGFRKQLPGSGFLIGPPETWIYRGGVWGGDYEGIEVVDPRLGPHAFWRGGEFQDGILQGMIRCESSAEIVTLITRGRPHEVDWRGLAVTFDRRRGVVEFRDRTQDVEETVSKPFTLPPNQFVPFHWETMGSRNRIWIGDALTEKTLPVVDHVLPLSGTAENAPPLQGRIGVAIWGGGIELDQLHWTSVGSNGREKADHADIPQTMDIARIQHFNGASCEVALRDDAAWVRQEAIAALCRTLFNVSEFVYVE